MKIRRRHLLDSKPENVRRLARWYRLRDIDNMSHRQLCALLYWLFSRREKRARAMTWDFQATRQ